MAEFRKDGPYVYATWVARLLAGDVSCDWQTWFRTQHENWSWKQQPSTFDDAAWQMDHAAMLGVEKERWRELGYEIQVENQNWFRLPGSTGTLGGKPDLVATKEGRNVIVDVKTGAPKEFHVVQVMTYMYALPRIGGITYGRTFEGKVVYGDHSIDIPFEEVDEQFIERLGKAIRTVTALSPPDRFPSYQECRFCPITIMDCPERVDVMQESEPTKDF